jgi:hypothetical protein
MLWRIECFHLWFGSGESNVSTYGLVRCRNWCNKPQFHTLGAGDRYVTYLDPDCLILDPRILAFVWKFVPRSLFVSEIRDPLITRISGWTTWDIAHR